MSTSALLLLLASLLTAAGIALYVAYVLLGVWRKVFWESLLLFAGGLVLAAASLLLEPRPLAWLVALAIAAGGAAFAFITLRVFAVPPTAEAHRGEALPSFAIPDHSGSLRRFDDLAGEGGLLLVFYRGPW